MSGGRLPDDADERRRVGRLVPVHLELELPGGVVSTHGDFFVPAPRDMRRSSHCPSIRSARCVIQTSSSTSTAP